MGNDTEGETGKVERDGNPVRTSSRLEQIPTSSSTTTAVNMEPAPATTKSHGAWTKNKIRSAEEIVANHIKSLQGISDLPSGWIHSDKPVRKRSNGKYRRPEEEAPIAGYLWNTQYGVWVPSVRLLHETSLVAKNTTKKVPQSSTSRAKSLPSSDSKSVLPTPVSRNKQSIKWSTEEKQASTTTASKPASTTTASKPATTTSTSKPVPTSAASKPVSTPSASKPVSTNTTSKPVPISTVSKAVPAVTVSKPKKKVVEPEENSTKKNTPNATKDVVTSSVPPKQSVDATANSSRKRIASLPIEKVEEVPSRSQRNRKKLRKDDMDYDAIENSSNEEDYESDREIHEKSVTDQSDSKRKSKKTTTVVDTEKDVDEDDDEEFHPNSMWQEPYSDALTLYERHRTARPAPKGTILCRIDSIRPEIRCAICLDILRNTRIVRECLHRFCEACIEQALTFQNVEALGGRRKECPICRIYIPSRRSLAPDTYMDTLIARLLDNLIWEEDNDPKVYLQSPNQSKNKNLLKTQRGAVGKDVSRYGIESHDFASPTNDKKEQQQFVVAEVVKVNSNEISVPIPDFVPRLIKVVLIQRQTSSSVSQKKYFDDLQQPYLTLTSDATGSVLKKFICRKHGYYHNNESSLKTNNGTSGAKGSRHEDIILWTMYREEPYLINGTDTLQYLLWNRTDSFSGRYMPIYYTGTGNGSTDIIKNTPKTLSSPSPMKGSRKKGTTKS